MLVKTRLDCIESIRKPSFLVGSVVVIPKELYETADALGQKLAGLLQKNDLKIVFAESCTAGLASAILGQNSGISNWLCGSAVTYRVPIKEEWLQIDPGLIKRFSAVSAEVTIEMARAVLFKTRDADFSIAVTGHLESGESEKGTFVNISVGFRKSEIDIHATNKQFLLVETSRCQRQWEAAAFAFKTAIGHLEKLSETPDARNSEPEFPKSRLPKSEPNMDSEVM